MGRDSSIRLRGAAARAGEAVRRHTQRRGWLRLPERDDFDRVVKPAPYLPIYEELMAHLRSRRFSLLELGVWNGDSLEMWRDSFPRATVVGVDLLPPDLDLGDRVTIAKGDQTDGELMTRLREKHAPDGFDVIIDDASHVGIASARSVQVLYRQHLRPGGLYIIEDWGTGYRPDWVDGDAVSQPMSVDDLDAGSAPLDFDNPQPVPMASHDAGMVGLVKRLVDHTTGASIGAFTPELLRDHLPIASMRLYDGMAVLQKPR